MFSDHSNAWALPSHRDGSPVPLAGSSVKGAALGTSPLVFFNTGVARHYFVPRALTVQPFNF